MSSSMHSADGASTASGNTRDLRRGSIMSFQTALSGTGTGFMSGSDADDGGRNGGNSPINPREDIWNDNLDPMNSSNQRLQPWLNNGSGAGSGSHHSGMSHGTSPDERVPGGWGGRTHTATPPPPPLKQQQQATSHAYSNSQTRLMPSPQMRSMELSPSNQRTSSPQLGSNAGSRMSGGFGHQAMPSSTSSIHSRKVSEGSRSELASSQPSSQLPPSKLQMQPETLNQVPSFSSSSNLRSPALDQDASTPTTAVPRPIPQDRKAESPNLNQKEEEDEDDEESALKRHTTIRASGQSSHSRTPSQPMPNVNSPAPNVVSPVARVGLGLGGAPSPAPTPPPKETSSPNLNRNQAQNQSPHQRQTSSSFPQFKMADSEAPTPPEKIPSSTDLKSSSSPIISSSTAAADILPPPLPPSVVEAQKAHAGELSAEGKFPVLPPADHSPVSDFRQRPLASVTAESQADGLMQLGKMQSQMIEQAQTGAGIGTGTGMRVGSGSGFEGGMTGSGSGGSGPIVGGERQRDLTIASMPQGDGPKNPMAPRRGSSGNLLPKAVLSEAPQQQSNPPVDLMPNDSNPNNSAMSESESISREPSPPPEGEIEARAQWVQAQMKLQQQRDKDKDKLRAQEKRERGFTKDQSRNRISTSVTPGASGASLRSQLKPLQLVSDDLNTPPAPPFLSNNNMSLDSPQEQSPTTASPNFRPTMVRNGSGGPGLDPKGNSSGALSTQQLQRQQARDQRRSVGALNMGMSGNDMAAGGSSGPYPAFSSPVTGATRPTGPNGARLYPGVLPQRSLVAPFELQQRPDGLLSGLVGPDGVRRSVNDPEVCLECMMRDEDMIDVQVLGQSLWERESDREFVEAVRVEEEEDRRKAEARERGDAASIVSHHTDSQAGSGSVAHESVKPSSRGRAGKRIGKSDPLTAERLKLHTQMVSFLIIDKSHEDSVRDILPLVTRPNSFSASHFFQQNPPASSHRWRTLQTFLAVQAKFIAMEQRARAETDVERKAADLRLAAARERERAHVLNAVEYDNRLIRARAAAQQDAAALLRIGKSGGSSRQRSSSASLLKDTLVVEDVDLKAEDRAVKEKDIASAREARRALAASEGANVASAGQSQPPSGPGRPPALTALNTANANPNNLTEEERRRFSSPLLANSAHSIPRRSGLAPAPIRAGSSQDLRSVPGAIMGRGTETPASVDSNGFGLAPPSMPFGSNGTPRGFGKYGGGSATSQLSLAPSGSMVDMHVGLGDKDRNEHRLSQAGFVLPGQNGAQSPSALNKAFYGFPESDGRNDLGGIAQANANAASAAASRQAAASPVPPHRSARGFDDELGPHAHEETEDVELERSLDQQEKPKKKGGLRGFFGGGKKKDKSTSSQADKASTFDARDSSSRKSVSSGSPRGRRASLGPDASMELAPPQANFFQRAMRSTSSLINDSSERDRTRSGSPSLHIYHNPPGATSQVSLDNGPFQNPLPPPRTQSKDAQGQVNGPSSLKQQSGRTSDPKKLRGSSSSPFMGPQSIRGQGQPPPSPNHPTSPSNGSRTNSMM